MLAKKTASVGTWYNLLLQSGKYIKVYFLTKTIFKTLQTEKKLSEQTIRNFKMLIKSEKTKLN